MKKSKRKLPYMDAYMDASMNASDARSSTRSNRTLTSGLFVCEQ